MKNVMRKRQLWGVMFALLLGIAGTTAYYHGRAAPPLAVYRQSRILLDTVIDVQVISADARQARDAIAAAYAEIQRIEDAFSRYRDASQIARINKNAGIAPTPVDEEARGLLRRAKNYGVLTDGLFDVTIGALVDLWGIQTEHERVPPPEEIRRALRRVDFRKLDASDARGVWLTQPQMSADVGGIAKGYAIDRALGVLTARHARHALINAGGDIRAIGTRLDGAAWRIGVKHPRHEGIVGLVELKDGAIVTSGDYERFFVKDGARYHHIFDPRTGMPAQGCQSVTILAPTAEQADALSTSVFIMGPEAGLKFIAAQRGVEAMIIGADGTFAFSPGFALLPENAFD